MNGGCWGVPSPTFGVRENSVDIGSLHHQDQVISEEGKVTYCLYNS